MSGIVYPSGAQLLRIPTTILLPSTATPFNPSAINPSTEQCWDSIKALESYGLFKTTFDAAQPNYPAGGSYTNTGSYRLNHLIFTGSGSLMDLAADRTYTRVASALGLYDAAIWLPKMTLDVSFRVQYRQTSASAADNSEGVCFFFEIPDACVLKAIRIRIEPDGGHGVTPATMPQIQALLGDVTTGGVTNLGTQVDPSNVAQYNVAHNINLTIADEPFDAGINTLAVVVRGEAGAGSLANLEINPPRVEYTRSTLAQEFGALVP